VAGAGRLDVGRLVGRPRDDRVLVVGGRSKSEAPAGRACGQVPGGSELPGRAVPVLAVGGALDRDLDLVDARGRGARVAGAAADVRGGAAAAGVVVGAGQLGAGGREADRGARRRVVDVDVDLVEGRGVEAALDVAGHVGCPRVDRVGALGRGGQVVRPMRPAVAGRGADEGLARGAEGGSVPVEAAAVLLDRDLDLGQAGGGAVLQRVGGGAADVTGDGAAACRVGGGVVVGVVDREADLRVRLLGVDQGGRVGRGRRGLVVAGLVERAGVEVVGAVDGAGEAEAAAGAGAVVGRVLDVAAAGGLRPQLDLVQAGGRAVLERVCGRVADAEAGRGRVGGRAGARARVLGVDQGGRVGRGGRGLVVAGLVERAGVEVVGAVDGAGEAEAAAGAGAVVGRVLGVAAAGGLRPQLDLVQAGGRAVLQRVCGRVADAEAGRGRVGGRAGARARVLGVDQGGRVGRGRRGLVVAGLVDRAGVEVVGAVDGAGEAEAAAGAGAVVGRVLGVAAAGGLRPQLDLVQAGGRAVLQRVCGRVADAEAGRGRVGGRAGARARVLGVDQGGRVGRGRRGLVVAGLVDRAGVEVVGAVDGAGEAEAAAGAGAVVGRVLGVAAAGGLRPQLDLVQAGGRAVLQRVCGRVADAEAGRGRVGGRAGARARVLGVDQGGRVGRGRRGLVVAGLVDRAGVEVVGAVDGAGEAEAAAGAGAVV